MLTLDFHTNKRVAEEVASIQSKRLRNKIAGFTTHLMKRIEKGPVRGISFKLQEEERERKDQYVPEVSALSGAVEIEKDTQVRELFAIWLCYVRCSGSPIGYVEDARIRWNSKSSDGKHCPSCYSRCCW